MKKTFLQEADEKAEKEIKMTDNVTLAIASGWINGIDREDSEWFPYGITNAKSTRVEEGSIEKDRYEDLYPRIELLQGIYDKEQRDSEYEAYLVNLIKDHAKPKEIKWIRFIEKWLIDIMYRFHKLRKSATISFYKLEESWQMRKTKDK